MLVLLAQLPLGAMQEATNKRLQKLESDYQKNKENLFAASGVEKAQKMLNALGNVPSADADNLRKKLQTAATVALVRKVHSNISSTPMNRILDAVKQAETIDESILESEASNLKITPIIHDLQTAYIFGSLQNRSFTMHCLTPFTLYEKDAHSNTLLHIACEKNDTAKIKTLLEYEKALATEDNNNPFDDFPAFLTAPEPCESILLTQTNKSGQTPLIFAAKTGNCDAIKTLLSYGAHPNVTDNTGKTALHYAASSKNHQLMKAIATADTDFNCVDNDGNTPLDILLSHHTFTTSDKDLCACLNLFKAHNAKLKKLVDNPRAKLALSMNLQPAPTQPKPVRHKKPKKKKTKAAPVQEAPTELRYPDILYRIIRKGDLKPFNTIQKYHDRLLIQIPNFLDYEDEITPHPLLAACLNDNSKIIEKLIGIGSNPDFISKTGKYRTDIALQTGFTEAPITHYMLTLNKHLFATLLQYEGLDLNLKNSNDETILDVIAQHPEMHYLIPMVIVYGANCFKGKNIIPDPLYATIIDGVLHNQIMITFDSKKQAYVFATIT
jgi:ankyrin repeat protein